MVIGVPVVSGLYLCLAPGIIAAVGFGLVGSHVAACPLRARWQAEVYHVRMMVVGTGELSITTVENDVHKCYYITDVSISIAIHIAPIKQDLGT